MNSTERYLNEFINEGLSGGARNLAGNDGPYNGPGVPGDNQRQILSGELFGSPTFAYEVPSSDLLNKQTNIQVSQAEVGQGAMRPVDNSSNNMYEQEVEKALISDLVEISRRLMKANKVEEAAKLYKLVQEGASTEELLKIALMLDESVDELKTNLFEAINWAARISEQKDEK